jgi:hypothetical protein
MRLVARRSKPPRTPLQLIPLLLIDGIEGDCGSGRSLPRDHRQIVPWAALLESGRGRHTLWLIRCAVKLAR